MQRDIAPPALGMTRGDSSAALFETHGRCHLAVPGVGAAVDFNSDQGRWKPFSKWRAMRANSPAALRGYLHELAARRPSGACLPSRPRPPGPILRRGRAGGDGRRPHPHGPCPGRARRPALSPDLRGLLSTAASPADRWSPMSHDAGAARQYPFHRGVRAAPRHHVAQHPRHAGVLLGHARPAILARRGFRASNCAIPAAWPDWEDDLQGRFPGRELWGPGMPASMPPGWIMPDESRTTSACCAIPIFSPIPRLFWKSCCAMPGLATERCRLRGH